MENIIIIFVFIFGLIVGSFLNVVIYRYHTGKIINGRSICFSCGKTLKWYELIPVLSFLFLRGKCSVCKSKISWQYPIVEIITGILFLGAFFLSPVNRYLFVYLCVQFSLLIVISVYDIHHKIIPDTFVYIFAVLAFAQVLILSFLFTNNYDFSVLLWDILAGPFYFLLFAGLWYFSRGKWLGFGDAKLALGIGWFLGFSNAYISIIFAVWAGAIIGIGLICYTKLLCFAADKKITLKSEIPFGPFLMFGFLITLFFESWVVNFMQTFFIF